VVNLGVAQNRTQRLPNLGSISIPEPSTGLPRLLCALWLLALCLLCAVLRLRFLCALRLLALCPRREKPGTSRSGLRSRGRC